MEDNKVLVKYKDYDTEVFCAGGCVTYAHHNISDIFFSAQNCKFKQFFFKELVKNYLNKNHDQNLKLCKGGESNELIKVHP